MSTTSDNANTLLLVHSKMNDIITSINELKKILENLTIDTNNTTTNQEDTPVPVQTENEDEPSSTRITPTIEESQRNHTPITQEIRVTNNDTNIQEIQDIQVINNDANIQRDATTIKRSMSQHWNRALHFRKTQYWQHIRNGRTATIFHSFRDAPNIIVPQKFQIKAFRGEPEKQTLKRQQQALNNFDIEIELLELRSENHLTKTLNTDENMMKKLSAASTGDTLVTLKDMWLTETKQQEEISNKIWEKKNKPFWVKYGREFTTKQHTNPFIKVRNYSPLTHEKQESHKHNEAQNNNNYNNNSNNYNNSRKNTRDTRDFLYRGRNQKNPKHLKNGGKKRRT